MSDKPKIFGTCAAGCLWETIHKSDLEPYAKTDDVNKTVASEIANIVANAPASFDTLKEMSDWINSHSDSAATMNSAIQTNADEITALKGILSDLESAFDEILGV